MTLSYTLYQDLERIWPLFHSHQCSDGGFLAHPLRLTELTLTPGERADIVIDFSQFAGGDEVVLMNSAPPMFGHPHEEQEKDIKDIVSEDIELLHNLVLDGVIPQIASAGVSAEILYSTITTTVMSETVSG